jgi:hypothetical protein
VLPNVSRALWAASLGTVFFGIGATAVLRQYEPAALSWLLVHTAAAWIIVGTIWSLSLGLNLVTCRRRPAGRKAEKAEGGAKGKPAAA